MKKIKISMAFAMAVLLGVLQMPFCVKAAEELPMVEQQAVSFADGSYTVEVDMEGGSGRATITSPTAMSVASGMATATITWSSPNYDYMLVNGEKYLPVNTEGNSVFEIPVLCMDEPMSVVADTTAMSTPHEITYMLTFHSASVTAQQSSGMDRNMLFMAGIVLLTAAVFSLTATKRK